MGIKWGDYMAFSLPFLNWPIYSGWTAFTPTVPKIYWDVYSQEQRIKQLCMNFSKAEQYLDTVATLTNNWQKEYVEIVQDALDEFEEILKGGIETEIDAWIEDNMERVIKDAVKMVFFGLTLDGYFVAYIPDSWADIIFDTGYEYSADEYGRLILKMQVDDTFQVANQPNLDY